MQIENKQLQDGDLLEIEEGEIVITAGNTAIHIITKPSGVHVEAYAINCLANSLESFYVSRARSEIVYLDYHQRMLAKRLRRSRTCQK